MCWLLSLRNCDCFECLHVLFCLFSCCNNRLSCLSVALPVFTRLFSHHPPVCSRTHACAQAHRWSTRVSSCSSARKASCRAFWTSCWRRAPRPRRTWPLKPIRFDEAYVGDGWHWAVQANNCVLFGGCSKQLRVVWWVGRWHWAVQQTIALRLACWLPVATAALLNQCIRCWMDGNWRWKSVRIACTDSREPPWANCRV